MAHIRIGDEHFNVAVDGPREAPVLIMSNSLGTDLRMWDPQMPELTKHFRVIRYDSRGHGASPADEGPYTIEKLGKDAVAILDKLGVDKAHWVGLSMGGMVGQWLLANAPNRISRAVLANTSAFMGGAREVWEDRAKAARDKGLLALVDGTLERWFTPAFRQSNSEIMSKISDMIANTPAHGYAACCLAIRDMDMRGSNRSIRKPVLVIVGEHDPATVPAAGQEIAGSIPGARAHTIKAAHLSNIEAADDFTNAVIAFLTGKTVGEAVEPSAAPEASSAPPAPVPAPRRPRAPAKPKVAAEAPKPAPAPAPANDPGKAKAELAPPPAPAPVAAKPAAPARKGAAKKTAPKKTNARRPAAKKAAQKAARKAAAKKAARKPVVKQTSARKGAAKKSSAKKAPAKKAAAKKSAAKKTARKSVAKKSPVKKTAGKKVTRKAVTKKNVGKKTASKKPATKKSAAKKKKR